MLKRLLPRPQPHSEQTDSNPAQGSPYSDFEASLPSYSLPDFKRCTAESTSIGAKNPNKINGQKSLNFEPRSAVPAAPVNVVGGGGFRFAGALTTARRRQAAAAIDAELGTGGDPIISSGGVRCFRIPSRRRRP
jgi:hypothetical protein